MRTIEEVIADYKDARDELSTYDDVDLEELEAWQAQRDTAYARIAELEDLISQMRKQRRRDGLAGQATLDEANNRIKEMELTDAAMHDELEGAQSDCVDLRMKLSKSPWTPVSEGLPEIDSGLCLLRMNNGEYIPAVRVSATHIHPDGDLVDAHNGDVLNPAQVLCWMPIPEYKPE